ncbi:MAG: trypsin-like peptidase domain-containing protein, partial [Chloroflexota bacterium]
MVLTLVTSLTISLSTLTYLRVPQKNGLRKNLPLSCVRPFRRNHDQRQIAYGTGFLVAPDLIMTNNHVIPDIETAKAAVAEFNYEIGSDGKPKHIYRFRLSTAVFHTSHRTDHDVTVVGIVWATSDGQQRLPICQPLRLNPDADPLPEEPITIIQHPGGGHKQAAPHNSHVVEVKGRYLHYTTDTLPGSSGAPVFNQSWQVIAIHRAHTVLDDPDKGRIYVNQGVLISHIRTTLGESAPPRLWHSDTTTDTTTQTTIHQPPDETTRLRQFFADLPGTLMDTTRLAPYESQSKEIVIGQRITIRQHRDGRFMPRPQHVAAVRQKLEALLQRRQRAYDPALFTLWIDGRSGSGKSVLLVQVMADLVAQGVLGEDVAVVWLDDRSEDLYPLLKGWAETVAGQVSQTLFLFIDDFMVQAVDESTVGEIGALLRQVDDENIQWPILVTCSPPEFRINFGNSEYSEGFIIESWTLPSVDLLESSDLIHWFEQRTGEIAHPLQTTSKKPVLMKRESAFAQAEGLMISMLVELRYDTGIMDFGQRFYRRLKELDLVEVLILPLVLNRLYLWTPPAWYKNLPAEHRDALEILKQSQDMTILDSQSEMDNKRIRLTHPHLSDVLYQVIRPIHQTHMRAQDIINVFEQILDIDLFTARQILRLVVEGVPRAIENLDNETLVQGMTDAWKEHISSNTVSSSMSAFFWTSWVTWVARDSSVQQYLGDESPVMNARLALNQYHHRHWSTLWLVLWQSAPEQHPQLAADAWVWLKDNRSKLNPDWAVVWRQLLNLINDVNVGEYEKELTLIGYQWVNDYPNHVDWFHIWRALLDKTEQLPEDINVHVIVEIGYERLKSHPSQNNWFEIWSVLLNRGEYLPRTSDEKMLILMGYEWIQKYPNSNNWFGVWRRIISFGEYLPKDGNYSGGRVGVKRDMKWGE